MSAETGSRTVYVTAFRHKVPGEGVGGIEWDFVEGEARRRVDELLAGDENYETCDFTFETDETDKDEVTDEADERAWTDWKRPTSGRAQFFVDVPNPQAPTEAWVNIAEFDTRAEALRYVAETFNADVDGRIPLISVLESEDADEAVPLDSDDRGKEWATDAERDAGTFLSAWRVPFDDLIDSVRLAMTSAGIEAGKVDEVVATVTDYAVNHHGDD